ncbi:tagatose-6-phosphate kinase [Streptococcus ictaluri]|uniref:Tagatose-6-phosphate kinase n=1 Tax=Streptococcus ictaluri 707-05 TaxID=764299 RepID=G5K496_9STRE|nr:tagatose-6-phosphate kinase [Streptococcus ictaluri]EHI69320.1 tagatose-6-phosphate kinase [Streptococcus ictaluri 707-05]
MILTITLNPSIDIAYPLDDFQLDKVNRLNRVEKTARGKGLNVSRVLAQAGQSLTATGLIGGHLGAFLLDRLKEEGISNCFYQIKEETRNCIAILHQGMQTEILEAGPSVSQEEGENFLSHLEALMKDISVVTISGSLPKGLDQNYYQRLLELIRPYHPQVLVDCSGPALRAVLEGKEKSTLIKPNLEELEGLLGLSVGLDNQSLKRALSHSYFEGLEWVVVSLGSKGPFAKHHNHYYRVSIPSISVVNPVGSGDATVAGLAWGLAQEDDDKTLLKKANALGILNAQEPRTGHVNMANYTQLINHIQVEEV